MVVVEMIIMNEIEYERIDSNLLETMISRANEGFDIVVEADGTFGPFDAHVLFKSSQINSCRILDGYEIVDILGGFEYANTVDDDVEVKKISENVYQITFEDETVQVELH